MLEDSYFASDLRLNGFPQTLTIEGVQLQLRSIERDRENDVTHAIYKAPDGKAVTVWND